MTKNEIVDAAFRVWGRNFYRKTSLSQLSSALKVSKPALYRHFKNKQALLDAMTGRFLDDFALFVKSDFENASKSNDPDTGLFIIVRRISNFFAGNVYALIFSLINIYDRNLDTRVVVQQLKSRGVDMAVIQQIADKKYSGSAVIVRLVFATLTFLMSNFHKTSHLKNITPAEAEIEEITSSICAVIKNGIGYSKENTDINFDELEKQVESLKLNSEPEPFFKAVAEAVAEAGPWDVSMDMVARRLGLSKSSLYGHFKNKKDMLRRLFVTEFKRIIAYARQGIGISPETAKQLYLGIYSIAVYLRSRPEILIAMDWIRTRKLDLGKPEKNIEIFRLFEDVDLEPIKHAAEEERQKISHWILFLLINILTQPPLMFSAEDEAAQDNKCSEMLSINLRILYKFITLGLGGFEK